jgi:hypothetical protein
LQLCIDWWFRLMHSLWFHHIRSDVWKQEIKNNKCSSKQNSVTE